MKKILIIVLASIIILSFGSCKENFGDAGINTNNFEATPKILSTDIFDNAIQIGNKVFLLPITYDDLIEVGASMEPTISPDYIMDKTATETVDFSIGETTFQVVMRNCGEKRTSLKNCNIIYISETKGKDIFYQKGVNVGTTLTELEDKWGEPTVDKSWTNKDSLTYIYLEYPLDPQRLYSFGHQEFSASGNSYIVTIDKNTSKIIDIQYIWNFGDNNKIIERNNSILTNEEYLNFKYPESIFNNEMIGNGSIAIYSINGQQYVISLDTNLCEFGSFEPINEETINSIMDETAWYGKYQSEILEMKDGEAKAIGYRDEKNCIRCNIVYLKDNRRYVGDDSKIIPLDENGEISPEAIDKFKEITKSFILSIEEIPAN